MLSSPRFCKGISGSTLKLIAILSMMIDHTGATVLRAVLRHPAVTADAARLAFWSELYALSRSIGRIAFPIFCFLIVEGFLHTRSIRRYAGRLFCFALISELPFDIALKGSWFFLQKQNVYFTLLLGLLVIAGIRAVSLRFGEGCALLSSPALIAAGMYGADLLCTDYNWKGVFLIAVLYLTRQTRLLQCMTGAAAVAWEQPASLGFFPVFLYNGQRGLSMKYFFYWFYPVHLLVLHVIAAYLIPAL